MSKKWKKVLKVVVLVVAIISVVYHLLFYVVKLPKDYVKKLEADYGEYILLSHSIQLGDFFPSLPEFKFLNNLAGYTGNYGGSVDRTLFFFRWDANAVKEELLTSFKKRVEEIGKLPVVLNCAYDEETFDVDITLDKSNNKSIKKYYEALGAYDELKEEYSFLRDFCKYNSTFNYMSGSIECHEGSSGTKEVEKKTDEDLYNKQNIKYLNEIILKSEKKRTFDFSNKNKIEGDSKDRRGGNICYLDLSDYSDITGKLDLSGFTELRYVVLKGMQIESVVLPDSLASIEPDTFENCKNLTKITIPKNVDNFTNPVFSGCKSLKEIIFEGNAPKILREKEDIFVDVPKDLVIYRKKSAKGWQETVWDKYDVRIME